MEENMFHQSGGMKLELESVNDVFELNRADRKLDGPKREDRATHVIGACDAADLTEGDGTLGKRPMVPGRQERMQRKDELRHQVDEIAAKGSVVGAEGALPRRDECDDRGQCMLCVAGEGGRASMIMFVRFSMDRWTFTCLVSCKDVTSDTGLLASSVRTM